MRYRLRIETGGLVGGAGGAGSGCGTGLGRGSTASIARPPRPPATGHAGILHEAPPSVSATVRQRVLEQARNLAEQGYTAAEHARPRIC